MSGCPSHTVQPQVLVLKGVVAHSCPACLSSLLASLLSLEASGCWARFLGPTARAAVRSNAGQAERLRLKTRQGWEDGCDQRERLDRKEGAVKELPCVSRGWSSGRQRRRLSPATLALLSLGPGREGISLLTPSRALLTVSAFGPRRLRSAPRTALASARLTPSASSWRLGAEGIPHPAWVSLVLGEIERRRGISPLLRALSGQETRKAALFRPCFAGISELTF